MNDSFGDNFNSTPGGVGAQPEKKAEGVVPVFIKQINDVTGQHVQMWGMSFGMISCVAIIRGIETSSTKITYLIEDHTGQLEAFYWLEEGDSLNSPDVMINCYARIYGTIRENNGKKNIMVFKMNSISGINELTTHLLEVLNARYKSEEFSKKSVGNFNDFSIGMGTSNFGLRNNTNSLGLEGKHFAVYEAIKNYVSDEGISMQELQRKFNHISHHELQTITDFMTQEGHIYTSIDAEHFLSTDV